MISDEVAEAHVKQLEEMLIQFAKNANPSVKDVDPYALGKQMFQWFQWFNKRVKLVQVFLEGMRSREALTRLVASLPDELEDQLPAIGRLFKFVPPIFLRTIMSAVHHVAKENPAEGGRPEVVMDIEAKREICKEILRRFWDGVPVGASQKRIAKRHRMSTRTVERIWRERQTLNSAEPRTISDLINVFSNLAKRSPEH